MCTPYKFRVEVVHPSADENLSAFIGSPALLRIADRSGKARHVHGLVREMHRLRRGNHLTHYESLIVPRLWFLGQTRNHRIFQNKSVSEIITLLLEGSPFTERSFAKLTADLPSARAQKRCSAIPAASSHGSPLQTSIEAPSDVVRFLPVVKAAWPIFTAGG